MPRASFPCFHPRTTRVCVVLLVALFVPLLSLRLWIMLIGSAHPHVADLFSSVTASSFAVGILRTPPKPLNDSTNLSTKLSSSLSSHPSSSLSPVVTLEKLQQLLGEWSENWGEKGGEHWGEKEQRLEEKGEQCSEEVLRLRAGLTDAEAQRRLRAREAEDLPALPRPGPVFHGFGEEGLEAEKKAGSVGVEVFDKKAMCAALQRAAVPVLPTAGSGKIKAERGIKSDGSGVGGGGGGERRGRTVREVVVMVVGNRGTALLMENMLCSRARLGLKGVVVLAMDAALCPHLKAHGYVDSIASVAAGGDLDSSSPGARGERSAGREKGDKNRKEEKGQAVCIEYYRFRPSFTQELAIRGEEARAQQKQRGKGVGGTGSSSSRADSMNSIQEKGQWRSASWATAPHTWLINTKLHGALEALNCGFDVLLTDADVVMVSDPQPYLWKVLCRGGDKRGMVFQYEYGTSNYRAHANTASEYVTTFWRRMIKESGKWWFVDQNRVNYALLNSTLNPLRYHSFGLTAPSLFLTGATLNPNSIERDMWIPKLVPPLPTFSSLPTEASADTRERGEGEDGVRVRGSVQKEEVPLMLHANWASNLGTKLRILSREQWWLVHFHSHACHLGPRPFPPVNITSKWPECTDPSWNCEVSER